MKSNVLNLINQYNSMKIMGIDTTKVKEELDRKFRRCTHVVGDIYRYYHFLFMKHKDGSYEYLCRDDEFEGVKYNYRDGKFENGVDYDERWDEV